MSNPIIYERTIASGEADGTTEKGIQIRAGCFARQFGDSDWTKIRVGILYRITEQGAGATTVYGRPRFCVGLCNGTTKIPGDKTWDNWLAVISEASAWSVANEYYYCYGGVTSDRWNPYSGSAGYTLWDMRNSVGDIGAGSAQYFCYETSSADMIFVDITKESTDIFSIDTFGRNTAITNRQDYPTDAEFETTVQSDTPVYSGYVHTTGFGNMSSSHSSYPLNSVFVYWERSDIPLEIIKLYVVRLS